MSVQTETAFFMNSLVFRRNAPFERFLAIAREEGSEGMQKVLDHIEKIIEDKLNPTDVQLERLAGLLCQSLNEDIRYAGSALFTELEHIRSHRKDMTIGTNFLRHFGLFGVK